MLRNLFTLIPIIIGLIVIVIFDLMLIIPLTKDQPFLLAVALLCEIVLLSVILYFSYHSGYKER